jgi:long-chain-fatty-acid--[acyl-carrier-protein] ligase
MKRILKIFLESFLLILLKIAFWFRYKVTVNGLDKVNKATLNRSAGLLFLPNHCTVFLDSAMITMAVWPRYRTRALIIEYMFRMPVVHWIMRHLDALPVPNFYTSSNSVKRHKTEKVIEEVVEGLKEKQNFLIYPAGRIKQTAKEVIDGASAVHRIIEEVPQANVVLVRIKGLWGSSFSPALLGKTPPMWSTLYQGIKHVFKNLLFFTPRRHVIIDLEVASADFPWHATRLELNKYLESWYNQPDGLSNTLHGDSLILVPYSVWNRKKLPEISHPETKEIEAVALENIPNEIKEKILCKIEELTSIDSEKITPHMLLKTDLGMDSLDITNLISFLQDDFDISGVNIEDLSSVGKLMSIAAKQTIGQETIEEEEPDLSLWNQTRPHKKVQLVEGDTLPEVFLNQCDQKRNFAACADFTSGVITYKQMKIRTLVLAEYLRKQPGEYIGIMLPASVAASLCILAVQLAGKVPVMVNWTVGPRHLATVAELSHMPIVLTSWKFLERLQNAELTGIEDRLLMLEDIRHRLTLTSKIKAGILSTLSSQYILRYFKKEALSAHRPAVVLFTSGTENMPKGVPLSHHNILSNQRDVLKVLDIYSDDVIFGILPPFHSFGFTISSLIGLLAGVRIAFSPDPTDGPRLAQGCERWGVSIVCAAPTFLKSLFKAAKPDQLSTLRLCVTGAEKLPQELEEAMKQLTNSSHLIEGYGITECAPVLTFTPVGKPRKGVGIPLPGVELCIVDPLTHKLLPKGTQGLILAHGPNVFSGYIYPSSTSSFLHLENQSWYITGDLGYLDEEGNLILSGRQKRFIKIGGEMISLSSIEDAISTAGMHKGWIQPDAPTFAIGAQEIPGERPRIFLYSTFKTNVDEVNKILRDAGFSNLVKVTSTLNIPMIPLMGSGKIDYRKLQELPLGG